MSNMILRAKTVCVIVLLGLAAAGPVAAQEAKKVSRAEAMRNVASRVTPDYPSTARQLRIQGEVELQVLIGTNGAVEKVDIVSGNPMLTRPAAEALRRWKFNPFTEDGKAVKVSAPISVAFKL
jgi:protein TonB